MNTWIINASPLILLGKIDRLIDIGSMLSPSVIREAITLAGE